MLSCESCQISENTFFTEYLWTTASDFSMHALVPSYSGFQREKSCFDIW